MPADRRHSESKSTGTTTTTTRKAGSSSAGKRRLSEKGKCTICGTEVSRKADIPRHMKIHSLDPTIKLPCPWEGCDFSTLQKSNLMTHYRRHTGDKPYECTDDPTGECKYRTGDPAALIHHQDRHRLNTVTPQAQAGPSNTGDVPSRLGESVPSPSETLQVSGCTESSPLCQECIPFPNCPQPFDHIWENNIYLLCQCQVEFLNLSAADPELWKMPYSWPGFSCTCNVTR